ncbi:32596_t:CDS:2, partial [Racocetra persica]
SYLTGNLQPSNTLSSEKTSSQGELDTQLESIEEKYIALSSQLPQKRQKLNFQNSSSKLSNDKTTSQNFVDVISQIQKETSSAKPSHIKSSLQIINNELEKLTSFIDDNDSTKPTHSDTSAL